MAAPARCPQRGERMKRTTLFVILVTAVSLTAFGQGVDWSRKTLQSERSRSYDALVPGPAALDVSHLPGGRRQLERRFPAVLHELHRLVAGEQPGLADPARFGGAAPRLLLGEKRAAQIELL